MKKFLSVLIALVFVLNITVAKASEVNVSIVNAVAENSLIQLESGEAKQVDIKFEVTGKQEAYASFDYVSEWTLENGILVPVSTATIETPPKEPGTTLEYYRTTSITVPEGQVPAALALEMKVFNIVNSNKTLSKLEAGQAATYEVLVDPVQPTPAVPKDVTAPIVEFGNLSVQPNQYGWNNTTVQIPFSATDDLSGVKVITPSAYLEFANEGKAQTQVVTVEDNAGNSASYTSQEVNIDKTAPSIEISGVSNGAVYKLNSNVPLNWTASDSLSGIESSNATVASGSLIDTKSVGTKSITLSATDKAGNITTKLISYKVVYGFSGILQPINSDSSSVFKQGSTVPVKFQLTDADGKYVSTAIANLYYAKLTNAVTGSVLEAISTSAATTGNLFRYDLTSNQYIFNLNTKALTIGTYNLSIVLDDGITYQAQIGIK